MRGPGGADLGGPLLLQRRAAVQPEQVRQRDVRPDLDRLPGPLRQQAGRDQPAHRLLQRIVVPLLPGPVILGPGRGGQRVQHRADDRGALRGQVPGQHPRAVERGLQPHAAVLERPVRVLIRQVGAGPLVHLGEQRRPGPAGPARARGGDQQDRVGGLPVLLRQLVGPLADGPAVGLRELPRGQRRHHLRVGGRPLGPGGMTGRRAPGDPGLVHQPGPRAVIRVGGSSPARR